MEAAPAQPFDVQVSGVLKGHGSEAETSVAHIPEEGIKIHFPGKGAGGRRLLRRPAPAADGVFPVVPGSAPAAGGVGDGGQGLQASRGIYQEIGVKAAEVSSKGKSIYAYEPSSSVSKAYANFTREVLADGRKKERLRSSDAR